MIAAGSHHEATTFLQIQSHFLELAEAISSYEHAIFKTKKQHRLQQLPQQIDYLIYRSHLQSFSTIPDILFC